MPEEPNLSLPVQYRKRVYAEGPPDRCFPATGMPADGAYELITDDLLLDSDPRRNLATFVTTWMEPEANRLVAENLHRNFIDHAEYPETAEIERRCIRMLADLLHAPAADEATGARTVGSSEAVMLGALAMKWRWRKRREGAGARTDAPNLVMGADVHVVWEKFCRYFDVEPRLAPLEPGRYTVGAEHLEALVDENTIGCVAVVGSTFTGQCDDIVGIDELLRGLRDERGLEVPLHLDGASGAFVFPFIEPDFPADFRLESVVSINASGHKFGLVYPGLGWLVFRGREQLPEELIFYENYLGRLDSTFTLNFSLSAAPMLAQYYNFIRLGRAGYTEVMLAMRDNARHLAGVLRNSGHFTIVEGGPQLPLVAFQVAEDQPFDEFEIADRLRQEGGWWVPAYTMPPKAQDVRMLRALVKENLPASLARGLGKDLLEAVELLRKEARGEKVKPRVKQGHGY